MKTSLFAGINQHGQMFISITKDWLQRHWESRQDKEEWTLLVVHNDNGSIETETMKEGSSFTNELLKEGIVKIRNVVLGKDKDADDLTEFRIVKEDESLPALIRITREALVEKLASETKVHA